MSSELREGKKRYETYIRQPAHVERIKERWKRIRADEFHVLADFDRTLTMGTVEGHQSSSIIAQIRNGGYLSPEYVREAHRLYDQYHPIEIDDSMPLNERITLMRAWWIKHFQLLVDSGLTKAVIDQVAREQRLVFREDTRALINTLRVHGVPLVILSAAPGDMIRAYLREEGIGEAGIRIVATMYAFDADGRALGVTEPVIHSLNKHEIMIDADSTNSDIHTRRNVLLLGDSLGDVGMIDGFDYDSVLKVGFLNDMIEEQKEAYMETFDIVIAHDGPMTPVNQLLHDTVFHTHNL